MIYLKWKLSEGTSGTGPEQQIADFGGRVSGSPYVDSDGYRIFYLLEEMTTGTVSDLDSVWDVSEVSEADALAFCEIRFSLPEEKKVRSRYLFDQWQCFGWSSQNELEGSKCPYLVEFTCL